MCTSSCSVNSQWYIVSFKDMPGSWLPCHPRLCCALWASFFQWWTHRCCSLKQTFWRDFWSPSESYKQVPKWPYLCIWAGQSLFFYFCQRIGWFGGRQWYASFRVTFWHKYSGKYICYLQFLVRTWNLTGLNQLNWSSEVRSKVQKINGTRPRHHYYRQDNSKLRIRFQVS